MKQSKKHDLRIGELLLEAHILSESDLNEAVKAAESTGLPIGRVLIMAGFVTETEFRAGVQAQSLMRDGIVSLPVAIQVMELVSQDGVTFEQALKSSGLEFARDRQSNKLGELLLGAGVVTRADFDTAMRTSETTGLPLGRLLISLGALSDELLATALNAQSLIRAGRISRVQALSGLRAARRRQAPLVGKRSSQNYFRGPQRPSVRLGELFKLAGLVNSETIELALERSLVEEKWTGQVLVQQEAISKTMLASALTLQEMVANETLNSAQAAQLLAQLQNTDTTLPRLLVGLTIAPSEFKTHVRYVDVLRVVGLVPPATPPRTQESQPASWADAITTGEQLLRSEAIDERVYCGSLRCYFLIASGWLTMQQGIIALNYFHRRSSTFDEVVQELGWTVHTYLTPEEEQLEASVSLEI